MKAIAGAELPTFPVTITEALQQIRDEDQALSRISTVLEADPGLSVTLLRVANSAAYGRRNPVQNIGQAVMLLGRVEVEALLLAEGVRRSVPLRPGPGFQPRMFWRLCARRAATARAVAEILDPRSAGESFTAGMLQDMAIPLLVNGHGRGYGELLAEAQGADANLPQLEQERFGWSHATVAGWLCEEWEFPPVLAVYIGGHHSDDANIPLAVRMVADLDLGQEAFARTVDVLVNEVGLSEERATQLLADAFTHGDELAGRMTG